MVGVLGIMGAHPLAALGGEAVAHEAVALGAVPLVRLRRLFGGGGPYEFNHEFCGALIYFLTLVLNPTGVVGSTPKKQHRNTLMISSQRQLDEAVVLGAVSLVHFRRLLNHPNSAHNEPAHTWIMHDG